MHRAAGPLAALLVMAGALSGCSGDAGPGTPDPGDPQRPEALPGAPSPGRTPSAATSGPVTGRPEFRGRLELVVRTGRRVFVRPSCTPDADGHRPCWGETALPYDLDGTPAAVTLVSARTDLDPLTDSWFVDLVVSPADAGDLAGALAEASRAGAGSRLALATPEGVLLTLAPAGARVDGDRLRLPGLDKPEAWSLVAEVAGRPPTSR